MFKNYQYLLCLLLATVIPFLIISPEHFPYAGLSTTFILLSSLIFLAKRTKSIEVKATYSLILMFSLALVLRANPMLTFFNIVAIIYLSATLVLLPKIDGLIEVIFSPLAIFLKVLQLKHHFKIALPLSRNDGDLDLKSKDGVRGTYFSIFLTFFLLLLIVPILSTVNPFFDQMLQRMFDIFQIGRILELLSDFSIFLFATRLVCATILIYILPRLLVFVESDGRIDMVMFSNTWINLLIPKIAVAAVIAIFFVAQIQLYTATTDSLKALGYSNSQLTREVFGQLGFVSMIIFALLYNDTKRSRMRNIFTYILIVEGIFLTFMAFKSVFDYSFEYGFTFKRLYGFSIVIWMLGLYGGFYTFYLRSLNMGRLIRICVLWTALILVGINVANFDNLIVHHSNPRSGEGVDYDYIRYTVSADGGWYRSFIDINYANLKEKLSEDPSQIYDPVYKSRELRDKYKKLDWRNFNYSEYAEYQSIKDLNLERILIEVDQYYRIRERLIQETDMRNGGVFVERQDGPIFVEVKPQVIEITPPSFSPMFKRVELR